MKTVASVAVLCLMLASVSFTNAARLERSLKQANATSDAYCVVVNGRCRATARVSVEAEDDAVRDIEVALNSTIISAREGADVSSSSTAFAQAFARAYATIISRHYGSVYVSSGGTACAFTRSAGEATASALARATTRAFARSSNQYASAAAICFSSAVASASVDVVQRAYTGTCTNYGSDYTYQRFVTIGYVRAIATSFSYVYTAIRDNDAQAAATCGASSSGSRGVIDIPSSG